MGLGDPFSTTYEGARQGFGTFGAALAQAGADYGQRKQLANKKSEQERLLVASGLMKEEETPPTIDEYMKVAKTEGKKHGYQDIKFADGATDEEKIDTMNTLFEHFGLQKPQGKKHLVIDPKAQIDANMTTGETTLKTPSNSLASLLGYGGLNTPPVGDESGFGTQVSGGGPRGARYTVDTPADQFTRASKIREEFINRPEVKDYVMINTNVKSMDSLLKKAKEGGMNNKVSLDQGLITMYNKLTDPSSVVRESEYARTPENLPLVNRFNGAFQKIEQGGAGLTDSDREALVWGAKVIADERGKTFNEARAAYKDLSKDAKVKESSVLRDFKEHQNYIEGGKQKENQSTNEFSDMSDEELKAIINGR